MVMIKDNHIAAAGGIAAAVKATEVRGGGLGGCALLGVAAALSNVDMLGIQLAPHMGHRRRWRAAACGPHPTIFLTLSNASLHAHLFRAVCRHIPALWLTPAGTPTSSLLGAGLHARQGHPAASGGGDAHAG